MKINDKSIIKLVKLMKKHQICTYSEYDLFTKFIFILENQKDKKLVPYLYINTNSDSVNQTLLNVESFLAALHPNWTMKQFVTNRKKFYELKLSSFINSNNNIEEDNDLVLNLLEILKSWSKKEK